MNMKTIKQFSIRDLSEITGVNAVTLRAWERRYGLLKPSRTEKGHRYYTVDDVEHVRNILNWLDRGVAISKVRPLLDTEQPPADMISDDGSHWQETLQQSLGLINVFQREKLAQQMNELFANYPLDTLARNYLTPLQDRLGNQAALRFGATAEKIFFDSELHTDLLARIRHANSNNNGQRLLLMALDGQQYSIQSLLLALALLEAGYRLHLLLNACSLREIPYIIEQASGGAALAAVICHCDSKPDVQQLEQELARAASKAHVPFFISGQWLDILPGLRTTAGTTPLDHTLRLAVSTVGTALRKPA
ncbi:MAG: MerR family transcriptional regulator [Cellvibrionales bacterium]|nr:MerR family transcriptional regulator [Cellvibrionales bacterium]